MSAFIIIWIVSVLHSSNFPVDLQNNFLGYLDNQVVQRIAYVKEQAEINNINSAGLINLFICESKFETDRVGDTDKVCNLPTSPNYGKVIKSRGVAQINNCSHPEVSNKEAFDFYWSVDWTINKLNNGKAKEWWHCSQVAGLRD